LGAVLFERVGIRCAVFFRTTVAVNTLVSLSAIYYWEETVMAAKNQSKQQAAKQNTPAQSEAGKSAQQKGKPSRIDQKDEAVRRADTAAEKDAAMRSDRSDPAAGQNEAVDQKRSDEQQYQAGGAAHDPHNRTQERVDRNDPEAGDIKDETRSENAPYNKTYGGQE
jgi:hypothetical protein